MAETNMTDFNCQSLIKFKSKVIKAKDVLEVNPEFFSADTMSQFGYQNFDIINKEGKNYLTIDRSIILNNIKVDLNTSVYELDEHNKIIGRVGSVNKKIRSITPFGVTK